MIPQWMQVVYKTYFEGNPIKRIFMIEYMGMVHAEFYDCGRDLPYDAICLKQFLKRLEKEE